MSMVGATCKKDFEVEHFDLPPLHGGGHRGKVFIVKSVKLCEISLVASTLGVGGAELPNPSSCLDMFLYYVASLLPIGP